MPKLSRDKQQRSTRTQAAPRPQLRSTPTCTQVTKVSARASMILLCCAASDAWMACVAEGAAVDTGSHASASVVAAAPTRWIVAIAVRKMINKVPVRGRVALFRSAASVASKCALLPTHLGCGAHMLVRLHKLDDSARTTACPAATGSANGRGCTRFAQHARTARQSFSPRNGTAPAPCLGQQALSHYALGLREDAPMR